VLDQQLLTALLTAAGTVIAGLLAWIGARQQKVADASKTMADAGKIRGFNMLVTKLQEERAQLIKVIDEQSEEITALRTEVRALTRQVVKLENVISKAGLDVPDARAN
jgi:predicted  nucleic acid-binding Zn-ribbon protein